MRLLNKYRTLAKLAEEHRRVPSIDEKMRHLGIILTIVGFFILAFYTALFEFEVHRFRLKVASSLCDVFLQFSALHLGMFVCFLVFCLPKGISFLKCKEPKLLTYRTFFAIIGFWTYSLARVWTSTIDNSLLYSTDAIWIVVLLYFLGIKIRPIGLLGIILGFMGIVTVWVVDFHSAYDFIGAIFGSISGFTLALITVITSYLVKQDPPLRIGFYQSLAGCISSLFIAGLSGLIQGWSFPSSEEVFNMFFAGIIFAFALFCLWQAFYYTESYVIGAASYFFPVFVMVLGWIINDDGMDFLTILGNVIISVGSLFVIADSLYRPNKGGKSYADSGRK